MQQGGWQLDCWQHEEVEQREASQQTGVQQTGLQQTGVQQTGVRQTGLQQTGLQQTGSQQSCWQGEEMQQEGWQLDCWQHEAGQELLQAGWQQGLDSQLTGHRGGSGGGPGHSSWGHSRGARSSSLDSRPPARRRWCRSHRTRAGRPGCCSSGHWSRQTRQRKPWWRQWGWMRVRM